MLVHALVTTIGASPEPSILLVLDSFDEILADLLGRRSGVAVLAKNNAAEFLFIPFIHSILLLFLFFILLDISGIGVEILLGSLALQVQIVTEFALAALFAVALLVENTDDRLRVDAKRNLLHLYGLEEVCGLPFGVFCGLLLCFTTTLLCFLAPVVGVLVGLVLSLHLSDLALGLGTFFLHGC